MNQRAQRCMTCRCAGAWTAVLLTATAGCRAPAIVTPPAAVSVPTWRGEGLAGRLLSTEHFDIISTLRDAPLEAALPGFLEAAHARYTAIVPPSSAGGPRLTSYIFASRREWDHFTRRRFASNHGVYSRILTGGFTEGTTSVSFHGSRSSTLATLAHEGWHQYLSANTPGRAPAWLEEGFACYHEAVDFAGREPRFTPLRNTHRIRSLRDALQQDRLIPLGELIDTHAGRVIAHHHGGVAQLYYAQVWALVTLLRHGAEGRYAGGLDLMLRHIADGSYRARAGAARITDATGEPQSIERSAFRTYFGESVEEMAEVYREHLLEIVGFAGSGSATSE